MERGSGVAKATHVMVQRLYACRARLHEEGPGWGCREQVELKSPLRGHDERVLQSGLQGLNEGRERQGWHVEVCNQKTFCT